MRQAKRRVGNRWHVQSAISARQSPRAMDGLSKSRRPPIREAEPARAGQEVSQMNRVLLTGRLTRDPEMRKLASGKTVTQFAIATNDYRGGTEKA